MRNGAVHSCVPAIVLSAQECADGCAAGEADGHGATQGTRDMWADTVPRDFAWDALVRRELHVAKRFRRFVLPPSAYERHLAKQQT